MNLLFYPQSSSPLCTIKTSLQWMGGKVGVWRLAPMGTGMDWVFGPAGLTLPLLLH